jgi:uncharacterized protein YjbJ (UPF0337 family)
MTVDQQVLRGDWNKIKGKLRERWGQLTNDQLESARGSVEQLVGTIQRQTGEARESVERVLEELTNHGASVISKAAESVREYAESAQDTVQGAARQAVDAARAGYQRTEETIQSRPVESLAICFGAGLITGVVLGLMLRSR